MPQNLSFAAFFGYDSFLIEYASLHLINNIILYLK
ncbi:hypothetical protein SAMN05444395_101584 [Flavobacterium fryxellicola]|nr:hypothetical protein SAMN05444395_101584 [Flavobacterium fryxellicola]